MSLHVWKELKAWILPFRPILSQSKLPVEWAQRESVCSASKIVKFWMLNTHKIFLTLSVSTCRKHQSLQTSESVGPWVSKISFKAREAACFLHPHPLPLYCASLLDNFNPQETLINICGVNSKQQNVMESLSSLLTRQVWSKYPSSLPSQSKLWGGAAWKRGEKKENVLCQLRSPVPSWDSAGPRVPAASSEVV